MLTRYGPWVAWGLVLWGVLQIGQLPWTMTHSICGPWGCGPPVPALIACHLAWLVILAPVAFLVPLRLSSRHSRLMGWSIIGIGVLGVVGVGVYEAATWLPAVGGSIRQYFAQRWAFSVVTLTDVPLLQSIVLGVIFVLLGREPVSQMVAAEDESTVDVVRT